MYWFRVCFLAFFALLVWTTLFVFGTVGGWWRSPIAAANDTAGFMAAASERIDVASKGNVALILIEDGEIVGEHYASVGTPVDRETLFQVASLGKFVAAWGVMTLVENGQLELDQPVSRHLTRWQLPESEFDNEGVTVRRLLSHTAGLTDGLGYGGFEPGQTVQPIEGSLTHAIDASPGNDGRTRVGVEPGTEANYSGGGFTLLQLLVEEVTGETFSGYMQRAVFEPLDMTRSTYVVEAGVTPNVSENFDAEGGTSPYLSFTSLAATSLYTTAEDMAKFVQANVPDLSQTGGSAGGIGPEWIWAMHEPQADLLGQPFWGMGVMLYASNGEGEYIFGYDGENEPAINATARANPANRDGFVALTTGNVDLAARLGDEWIFWQTGKVGGLQSISVMIKSWPLLVAGWALILFAGAVWLFRFRPTRPTSS